MPAVYLFLGQNPISQFTSFRSIVSIEQPSPSPHLISDLSLIESASPHLISLSRWRIPASHRPITTRDSPAFLLQNSGKLSSHLSLFNFSVLFSGRYPIGFSNSWAFYQKVRVCSIKFITLLCIAIWVCRKFAFGSDCFDVFVIAVYRLVWICMWVCDSSVSICVNLYVGVLDVCGLCIRCFGIQWWFYSVVIDVYVILFEYVWDLRLFGWTLNSWVIGILAGWRSMML